MFKPKRISAIVAIVLPPFMRMKETPETRMRQIPKA